MSDVHEQEEYERAHGVQAPGGGGGYRPPPVGGEPYVGGGYPPQQFGGGPAGFPPAAGGAHMPAAPSQVRLALLSCCLCRWVRLVLRCGAGPPADACLMCRRLPLPAC